MTLQVAIEGVAFWASRLPGWDLARAVIRGEQAPPEAASARPAPTLLAPTERRRAPDTVAVALEVAGRACEAAGRKPSDLPSVFASTHGDLAISDYMCSTLAATPALISPIKFHNSVHNAAAGYWSIGTGSLAPYTAISAYEYTFGAGLIEAATQAACEERPVLYVAFDIEAKGALASMAPSRGLLGAALVLAPASAAQKQRSLILTTESVAESRPTAPRSAAAPLVADNALAPCLPFFEILAMSQPRTLCLALSKQMALNVQVN
ncbi:beta-ketoacyl synthase chain length factor [Steroidobacter sp. S1-65]|uniref:Beta-ketoacyl synthase chain length factor n=1 Tax=Steroidobacter gossypii TaxID=2805490 RepID=A0ABS1WTZ8_9GAMM|nr:beta-ketoacyl synthase chain length factor [Steroidobacter gossypii]MBM0104442.1 beta-ketoacyl synthase chain length factor [Steroidobacter gossypii]